MDDEAESPIKPVRPEKQDSREKRETKQETRERVVPIDNFQKLDKLEHISAVEEKDDPANSTIESFYSSTFNPKAAPKEVPTLKLDKESVNPLEAEIEGLDFQRKLDPLPEQRRTEQRPAEQRAEPKKQEKHEKLEKQVTQTRFDQFMNFLGNIESEFQVPTNRSQLSSNYVNESSRTIADDLSTNLAPREAYSKVRERMIELELEKEE